MKAIEHEFYDKDFMEVSIDDDGDAKLKGPSSNYYLEKADTIAIAKAQGVTAEDLEG